MTSSNDDTTTRHRADGSVAEQVGLDAQLRWLTHLHAIDATAEQIEQALAPLRVRAQQTRAVLAEREREHHEVIANVLDRLRTYRQRHPDSAEDYLAEAAADVAAAWVERDYQPGRDNRAHERRVLARPVTDTDLANAPSHDARRVLVDIAAAQSAIEWLRHSHEHTAHTTAAARLEHRSTHTTEEASADAHTESVTSRRVQAVYENAYTALAQRAHQHVGGQHDAGEYSAAGRAALASEAGSRDAQMVELRTRRPGLFRLHEAAINAVWAREHAHQGIAEQTLHRLHALVEDGLDDPDAAARAAEELVARLAADPDAVQRGLDQDAVRAGGMAIDPAREARVLAVPVTDDHIDAGLHAAERDMLIDLAACQHAVTALRDTGYADTARDAADLYVECRQAYGHDPDQARAVAWLEVFEGTRAHHDTAAYRLAERRVEQRTQQRGQVGRADPGITTHEQGVQSERAAVQASAQAAQGSALPDRPARPAAAERWEEVRAPLLRTGDLTPRGPVTAIDYHGELGVTVHVGDEEYHRGLNDLVSRQMPARGHTHEPASGAASPHGAVDGLGPDEVAALIAGAHGRRASAATVPDDLARLPDGRPHDDQERDRGSTGEDTPATAARGSEPVEDTGDTTRGDDAAAGEQARTVAAGDPVAKARAAVDVLTTHQGEQQRRRAVEQARTEQLNRWHHDDQHTDAAAARPVEQSSTRIGGRAIYGWGAER